MIKIDLDATPKGKTRIIIKGNVEVRGDIHLVAHEIYAVINDFKENCPEALELALEMLVDGIDEEEEE